MKIPLEWLKDFIAIRISPEQLAERLTMAGLEVKAIGEGPNGVIFEVEVTPNRPDWLSIFGVAREVAAVTGEKFRGTIDEGRRTIMGRGKYEAVRKMQVRIHDFKVCPRYIGRVIEGVKVATSPALIARRLAVIGVRPISNVVDVTNYVLFELGQPLHAFDLDKLRGRTIHIRFAKEGEEIVTIDGVTRKLTQQDLVIADESRPVAIAGLMGGKETEVTEKTTSVFLESACFDPVMIRWTARRLGLTSESSYRFERGVSLENVLLGSNRAVELILKWTQAEKIGSIVDQGKKKTLQSIIPLDMSRIERALGETLTSKHICAYLERLGLGVKGQGKKNRIFAVSVPWFRRDLKESADLVEEIARIHGYGRFSPALPSVENSISQVSSPILEFQDQLRQWLIGLGFQEAMCYSLIGQELLELLGESERSNLIRIENPMSQDYAYLTPTLILGLARSAQRNFHRQLKSVALFELSKTYAISETNGIPQEVPKLGLMLAGTLPRYWGTEHRNYEWFDLKGILESLFSALRISSVNWQSGDAHWSLEGEFAFAMKETSKVGFLGQLNPKILTRLDIEKPVVVAELDVNQLLQLSRRTTRFKPLPKFPAIDRDIALEVKESVSAQQVIQLVQNTSQLLAGVEIFDVYKGPQLSEGYKSLALSLEYRAEDRTLTDEEVNSLHRQVGQMLQDQLGAKVR